MFTVKEFNANTYAASFSGLTGWPVGSGSLGVGVTWLLPTVVKEFTIKGNISQSSETSWGDRSCLHFDATGEAFIPHTQGVISTTVVDPTYTSGYKGQRYSLSKTTIKFADKTSASNGGPIWTPGYHSFEFTIPDHSHIGVADYRNIKVVITMTPNSLRHVTSYEVRYGTGAWSSKESLTLAELDGPNKRYRYVGQANWTNLKLLLGGSSPIPFSQPVLSTKDWSDGLHRISGKFLPETRTRIFGDLCRRCANDAKGIDTNGISLVRELATLSESLSGMLQLLRGKKTIQNVSSMYLSYTYGTRLTYADLKKIIMERAHILRSLGKSQNFSKSSNGVVGSPMINTPIQKYTLYTYKVVYKNADNDLSRFISHWIDSGLFPTLETGWDMIPYSFVADWFLDVQGALQQYDATTYWSVHDIVGATGSTKETYSGVPPGDLFPWLRGCVGMLAVKRYRRFTDTQLILPSYFDDTPRDFKNFAELTALILQRKKN